MIKKLVFISCSFIFLIGCSTNSKQNVYKKIEKQGDKFFAEGKKTEAIKEWENSLKIKKNSNVYDKIVFALLLEGKNKEAKKWAEEGLTYFPNCVNLIYNFAYLNFLEGNNKEAMENINRLLNLNSCYPEGHYMKGVIYEKEGNLKLAKEEYIKEININPGCKKAWKKIKEISNEVEK